MTNNEAMKTWLLGATLKGIEKTKDHTLEFVTTTGLRMRFEHDQDCCESVFIESIVGDLDDLIGEPLLVCEETSSGENPPGVVREYQDSFTWTFYKFATRKGYVDIRWYGESNGYYSERVDLFVWGTDDRAYYKHYGDKPGPHWCRIDDYSTVTPVLEA